VGVTNDGSQTSRQAQLQAASVPESDGLEDLYAEWQTEPWSPDPVGPNDDIPVNDYNNVELALINPGLVHLEQKGMAQVAKKLGL
jgi:xeroderma pigmentosum group C-complementing protein